MSELDEIQHLLHSLGEIRNIMSAMKNIALMEIRKLTRFTAAQSRVVENIETAAADFLNFYGPMPLPVAPSPLVYILVGSERGFCGDFNESAIGMLEKQVQTDAGAHKPLLIAVGQRLTGKLPPGYELEAQLEGPSVAEEVPAVIGRLLDKLGDLQRRLACLFPLTVIHHLSGDEEKTVASVLEPFRERPPGSKRFSYPPLLNLSPQTLFAELVDHYLFAVLFEIFYGSLTAENRRRTQHMEGAIKRLDERRTELTLKLNTLRQEQITEEIEIIMLSAEGARKR